MNNSQQKICPTCQNAITPKSTFVPFCSERCKLIDLGEWAKGNNRIPIKRPVSAEEMQSTSESDLED